MNTSHNSGKLHCCVLCVILISFILSFVLVFSACAQSDAYQTLEETGSTEKNDIYEEIRQFFLQVFLPDITLAMNPQNIERIKDNAERQKKKQEIFNLVKIQQHRIIFALYKILPYWQNLSLMRYFETSTVEIETSLMSSLFNQYLKYLEELDPNDLSDEQLTEATDRFNSILNLIRYLFNQDPSLPPEYFITKMNELDALFSTERLTELDLRYQTIEKPRCKARQTEYIEAKNIMVDLAEKSRQANDSLTSFLENQENKDVLWAFDTYLKKRYSKLADVTLGLQNFFNNFSTLTSDESKDFSKLFDLLKFIDEISDLDLAPPDFNLFFYEFQFLIKDPNDKGYLNSLCKFGESFEDAVLYPDKPTAKDKDNADPSTTPTENQTERDQKTIYKQDFISEQDGILKTLSILDDKMKEIHSTLYTKLHSIIPNPISKEQVHAIYKRLHFIKKNPAFQEIPNPNQRLDLSKDTLTISWLKSFINLDYEIEEKEVILWEMGVMSLYMTISYLEAYKQILLNEDLYINNEDETGDLSTWYKELHWQWFKYLDRRDM